MAIMEGIVMTYNQAVESAGSKYFLAKLVDEGRLYKVARGAYSSVAHPDPLVVASVLHPDSVVTMDSALYAHGFTDVIPEEVHLATSRGGTRINKPGYRQYFTEERLLEPGSEWVERADGIVRIYNRERMLVEVMRKQASLPLDYYKEVIGSYRRVANELDIPLVEEYMDLFDRRDFMFDILQREVL